MIHPSSKVFGPACLVSDTSLQEKQEQGTIFEPNPLELKLYRPISLLPP